jgi:hypothetical protein
MLLDLLYPCRLTRCETLNGHRNENNYLLHYSICAKSQVIKDRAVEQLTSQRDDKPATSSFSYEVSKYIILQITRPIRSPYDTAKKALIERLRFVAGGS